MVRLTSDSLKPLIDVYQTSHPIDWSQCFDQPGALDVEIGFGIGETLIRMAQTAPQRNFIGLEQNWERICKTLRQIELLNRKSNRLGSLNNIRILKVDARLAFERLFEEKSLDRIFCLFPCPWPKTKHTKHRLFSAEFLRLLNNRLKDQGLLKIVTDHYPFLEWILEEAQGTGFEIHTQKIHSRYDTKFERKWVKAGQKEFFEINASKQQHETIVPVKDIPMESYLLKDFDPAHFRFEQVKEKECSIIFKEMLFDPLKHKAMLHFVVSEGYLTQHFWVMIIKKANRWRVCKADGQTFFQTSGTARTLQLVYERAKI